MSYGTEPKKDHAGCIIDRRKPTDGQTKRTKENGYVEFWCNKCRGGGRWGSHDTKHHDEWVQRQREKKAEREAQGGSPTNPPSMHRVPNANFCRPSLNFLRDSPISESAYDSDQSF